MGGGVKIVEQRKIQLSEKLDPTAPCVLLGWSIPSLVSNFRSFTAHWRFIHQNESFSLIGDVLLRFAIQYDLSNMQKAK